MVVSDANIHNIMGGMESTTGVRLHNHRRKLKQRFDIIKKLGQGTYGKVQLGINKETGQEVAIKTIKKAKIETEADLIRIRREIQIMSSVQHPNIIHIYEVFENREKMVLVMEYAAGGELYDYLSERKVLAEEEARRIFRQIATAVYYCHKHKICHRDLKLENILLDEHGSAKIADFGLSNVFDEQRLLNTFCGSPLYASPEIVKGTPYHGPEVDCWSLGVLLYTLVYGAMPFDGSNFKRLVKQISQGDYFEPKKPSPASPLIREMLTVNPARRADIEKICAHWWVNEGHSDSCLDIAEELANQTPVRLDLLLSLAPPPPGVGSEKLLVTSEEGEGTVGAAAVETVAPVRCHSVGSLMDLDTPAAERKIREFERERESGAADILPPGKDAPKRKLEEGISTEDAARGGAKKKERNRRRDSEHSLDRKAAAKSSKPAAENDTRQTDVEMMDVDVDVTVTLPLPADAETSVQQAAESVKKVPSVLDNVTPEDNKTPEAEKIPEKESANVTVTAGKSNRKSVKKKCKPPSEGPPVNSESVSKKESSEQIAVTNEENCAKTPEEKPPSAVEVNGEVSKVSDVGETVESVKPKLKKKKKVLNTSKSEVPSEQLPNGQEVLEQSSQTTAENKLDSASVNSSQCVKSEETRTVPVSDISDADSKNSRETTEVKAAEAPKTSGIKTKKSRGELSLGKLNADKTSDEASPLSKPTERRRSKIFENADKFNVFLGGSSPEAKSPTSEKPKKVFIPGVKVSDFKQAFERRSSLSGPPSSTERRSSLSSASQSSLVKHPAPKKPAEQSAKTVPKSDSTNGDTAAVGKPEVVPEPAPQTKQEQQPSENETAAVQKDVNENVSSSEVPESDSELKLVPALQVTDKASQQEKARIKKLKDAVEVISNAIAEETKRETGKKVSSAKPPVPSERTKSKSGSSSSSPKSPPLSPAEAAGAKKSPSGAKVTPEAASATQTTKFPFDETKIVSEEGVSRPEQEDAKQISQEAPSSAEPTSVEPPAPEKKKSAKVEITLKSATLPRRKTSKAEIQLGYPQAPAQPVSRVAADKGSPAGEYRTEVEQMVGSSIPPRMQTQRSEVAFPVAAAATTAPLRSASMEPESSKSKPKERIIPIQVEKEAGETAVQSPTQPTPPKPPVPPLQQRSMSQRSSSLSRQSTQDSDTDSTISASGPEPIRKSPREYIIPIAVEGGGYVTPRASSLEPSESTTTESTRRSRRSSGRLSRPRRMSSLLSDSGASEDEGFNSLSSPFGTLHRHSSLGRDGENPDDDMPFRHMHKLRSSRPKQATLEHNDSFSSAEEEDDDDGFEILTAESLFSTLLSRVRSLTQRLNVEDGGRPGFPSSRLLGHLGSPSSGFWSSSREPISRRVSEGSRFSHSSFGHDGDSGSSTPWRRSQTREPSECDSTYSEAGNSTNEGTLPRGSSRSERGSFSEEPGSDISSCASYYTPSLARRLQHHRHASSEDVRDQDDDWSLTSPMRKSSLGMLPSYRSTTTQPTNSPSRRLSRTLSMRTSADTRSRDYYSSASVGADRRRISDLSSPSSYSSSLLGTQDSIKKDYLPPTRRSLHMLDSRNTSSIPKYKGSSASDSGDYSYRSRVTDYDRVLPPLPYSASTRKESLRSLYARQRSLDSSASSYSGSRHVYSRIQEEVQERPHHSSSVPLVGGSATEGKVAHIHSRIDEYKTEKSSNFNPKATFTSDKCKNEDNSTSLKDNDDRKTNMGQEPSSTTSAKKGRQIPSLLRLRSSSASREINKDNKESEGKLPRSSSMSISTPDRSVLGKFLCQSSEGKDVPSQETEEGKKKVRRISRFLRPDFYDTPREESIYAKEQDAKKAAEAEAKLKRRKSLKKTESNSSQTQVVDSNNSTALAPSNPDSSVVKDAAQSTSKKHKEKGNETKETKLANNKKNSNVSETRRESSSPAFEKQCSTSPTKSGFLHSLEKKLIKFKSSGDDIPVITSSGKSRIDKAIHSLREKSLTPRGSDIVTTESHLLKRAVSVDDCSTADGGANSPTNTGTKLGNRVTSVLGLFRKYEDAPTKGAQASPPRTSVLSRLRRTQSVYAGSQSDSVLTGNENVTSQKKSSQDSQILKKTQSNSSLGNKNINKNSTQIDASKQKSPSISTKSKKSPEKLVKVTKRLEENINMNTVSIHPNVKTKENTSITTEPMKKDVANPPALLVHDSQATVTANCNSTTNNNNVTNTTSPSQQIVNVLSDVPKTFNEEQVVESINRLAKQESQDQETAFLAAQNHTPITREQPAENMGTNNNIIGSRIPNSSAGTKTITHLTTDDNLNNEVLLLRNLKVVPPDVLPGDVSPTDELESLDSWSVCSDLECHDFPMSPILPPGDETESVGDRIRRKSFYTRFNDVKKKHRKPSLTSFGTLSPSYREPNTFYAKKRHHSSELALQNSNLKPHRSKSLSTDNGYGVLPERKSPVPQKGSNGATPLMNGCDDLVNGSLTEEHCPQPDDSQTNGGSREILRLPRHFNSNVNLSYNVPSKQNFLRRASDTRLSRSTESNIGGAFQKSRLPTPVNRVSKVCTIADNESRLGSGKLDTLPLHGKYKRCNSENAADPQLPTAENQDGSAVVCEQVSPH